MSDKGMSKQDHIDHIIKGLHKLIEDLTDGQPISLFLVQAYGDQPYSITAFSHNEAAQNALNVAVSALAEDMRRKYIDAMKLRIYEGIEEEYTKVKH